MNVVEVMVRTFLTKKRSVQESQRKETGTLRLGEVQ
jgi:hypothetical protein